MLADSHLCRQQYGRVTRSDQICTSLLNAIDAAHNAGCRYILHAGDLLDSNTPGAKVAICQLQKLQDRLIDNRMHMYVIRGNHDSCDPPWWHLLETFACNFDEGGVAYGIHSAPTTFSMDGVRVYAKDWATGNVVKESVEDPAFADADIAMFHSDLGEICSYSSPTVMSARDVFDEEKFTDNHWPTLVVFGHIHHFWHTQIYPATQGKNTTPSMVIASPGSTDVTSRQDDRKSPFSLFVATYEVEEGQKAKRIGFDAESISYDATDIYKADIREEKDMIMVMGEIDKKVQESKVGIVYYIDYALTVKDCVPRLQSHIDGYNWHNKVTLVTCPLPQDKLKEEVKSARDLKTSPAKYFSDHHGDYIPEEYTSPELLNLCDNLLNPEEDGKARLIEYVGTKLGETIL